MQPESTVQKWTNPSVIKFAAGRDPITAIAENARAVVLNAQEDGWQGPPFDPIELARLLKIEVVPRQDVNDARLLSGKGGRPHIEFNPDRPRGRLRYSIAHEIAHTFFEDFAEVTRHRLGTAEMRGDDWQLEMLCNIAASELLMPVGSFNDLRDEILGIDHVMDLRRQFDVSAEAILIRITRLTNQPCIMFAARRDDGSEYSLDYTFSARHSPRRSSTSIAPPSHSVLGECTAIGYTAKGDETWTGIGESRHVECVGIPPYPGHRFPRVVGILREGNENSGNTQGIRYVKGSALEPRGRGKSIVAHVVNDKTSSWGGGFALEIRKKWRHVQEEFIACVGRDRHPTLGATQIVPAADGVFVCSMVAQHGYGPSSKPGVRYGALADCLKQLAQASIEMSASVHMPRIGCGQAGGRWEVVSGLVDEILCGEGIEVTVYDLPDAAAPARTLF